jgi:hypothetical protein
MLMKECNIFTELRIFCYKDFFIFRKNYSSIQIIIPLITPYYLHEVINGFRRDYFAEYPAGIPFDKYIPKIEDNVFYQSPIDKREYPKRLRYSL